MLPDSTICEQAAKRWTESMLQRDFEAAWRESDLIESTKYQDPHRLWTGEPWAGKRVMLRCLHGFGDTIHFIRYAPLLKQSCSYLTVQTRPELVRLVRTVSGVDSAITWEQPEKWDVQVEVTELPRVFRTTLPTIRATVPYVQASRTGRNSTQIEIVLVWRSSQWNLQRSISFDELDPLFEETGCTFHYLQKDADEQGWDVLDTAERMAQLDLVISVDTMSAHLAGAPGKPVWILLPFEADWRWMRKRTDSPWYPTARLFRQRTPGDWFSIIASVRNSLKAHASLAPLAANSKTVY
jgi:hypothetical protein